MTKQDERQRAEELQEKILSCPETDERAVRRSVVSMYRKRKHPNPQVPVLFVQSPAHAIAQAVELYVRSMRKIEDGFMLKLQLPGADPILVKSGVKYPTFLQWDFAAALFRTNGYVKTASWAYGEIGQRDTNDIRQIILDLANMVNLHVSRWRRWTEGGKWADVFRKNPGYWPIARQAALGMSSTFPGSALGRVLHVPRGDTKMPEMLDGLADHAFLVFPYDHFVIVMDYPEEIVMDEQGRLGKVGSPAIKWRDGTGTYVAAGRMIPKYTATGKLTYKKIIAQDNAEVKRVLISSFGEENFLEAIEAEVIASDEWGTLYHAPALPGESETFAMIQVVNSTPEPDGTHKRYYLRVDPRATSPAQAVAASFRMDQQGRVTDWRLQGQQLKEGWKYQPYAES